jgi:hypothetical protein
MAFVSPGWRRSARAARTNLSAMAFMHGASGLLTAPPDHLADGLCQVPERGGSRSLLFYRPWTGKDGETTLGLAVAAKERGI